MTGLPTGVATGIGSLPGTDPREAVRISAGEVALPFLPELPARGPGADLIGRTAALLVDIPMDYVHRSYRLCATPSSLMRLARDYLRWDLDALEEQWESGGGAATVKVQACGPFTLAAYAELRGGHRIARDRGAVADVAASLAAGLAEHAAEVQRRLGAQVVVQLDEPALGPILDGTVTPLTRLDPIRPIPAPEVIETLRGLAGAVGRLMVLHSCARPRWEVLGALPEYALALDLSLLGEADYDPLGGFLDRGGKLVAGVLPGIDPPHPIDAEPLALRVAGLFDRIGLPRRLLAENLQISPACGLAGASSGWAVAALRTASTVAGMLGDLSAE